MTWNVHGCVGSGGRFDPEAIAQVLRRSSADIVALQEVDAREPLSGGIDTFEFLRRELGWCSAEARTIRTHAGDYGHLIMSRWTIESVRRLDLSMGGHEPRAAIICEIGELGVRAIATHLGLRARERRRQIRAMVDSIDLSRSPPLVVLGDFNEWRRFGVATRLFCPPLIEIAALPSFPAWRPFFRLDRIWCAPQIRGIAAHTESQAAHLSDHLPVVADLELGGLNR